MAKVSKMRVSTADCARIPHAAQHKQKTRITFFINKSLTTKFGNLYCFLQGFVD
jgi:hypothetical protein